ncbi:carboxypeptidase M32 [Lujinxingia sediminis]|uniref:Metal-dependent carboxypeptidase n=1 Tax=Lujinxingia sediminis TaxID=2480984 RepID=A0ABY0CSB4_9DELT|nr:carboxypeptidase M32 [Lujinxingia sediminis]RVU43992.1 carboxypeptidase M32 [Lujinxingia sediminis]
MSAYAELAEHFGKIGRLGDAVGVLYWDMATMMPAGGAEARSEQIATLRVIHHELQTDPKLAALFEQADGESLDAWQKANVEEMRRQYTHATAVPSDLVSRLSRKGAQTEMVWRSARADNDFGRLAPHLAETVELVRETARIKSEALGVSPYDALLDQYEPGGSSRKIDAIFDDLAGFLPEFLEAVLAHQAAQPEAVMPTGDFSVERQEKVARELMATLGFDFEHGRLDTSHHPFCGGVPDDVRLTTYYDPSGFIKGMMGVMHETGHALYERGLPVEWRYQPVGAARGMSVHESQSLLVEMQACRSRAFATYVAPIYKDAFAGTGDAWEVDNLYRVMTRVERSLIRVDADEVTYPAHVILRYRLEKAMLSGDLQVADLPGAWREGMKELLGIEPEDDRDGCMQDIHWMDGTIGYFPTYTLGAMTAAQLFAAADRELGDVEAQLERGEFGGLMGWMGEKIHAKGSLLSTDALLTEATGETLNARYFKDHLRRRYLPEG